MFQILLKEQLSPVTWHMRIEAPFVAKHAMPAQFLIVRADAEGERIPLTIADFDREQGTIDIVIQPIGAESDRIAHKNVGDCLADVVGPLGQPSEFTKMPPEELKAKKILYVAGGFATAPVYCQLKWLKEQGVFADVIEGARTKDLIILEDQLRKVAGNVYITTDDGSYGRSGMVTNVLQDLYDGGARWDVCVAIGPMPMMKFTSKLCTKLGIPCIVSMNPIMVDGTGMCGACRLLVGGEVKFACVDGPEFPGDLIDWDAAVARMKMYKTAEGRAYLEEQEGATHSGGCELDKDKKK